MGRGESTRRTGPDTPLLLSPAHSLHSLPPVLTCSSLEFMVMAIGIVTRVEEETGQASVTSETSATTTAKEQIATNCKQVRDTAPCGWRVSRIGDSSFSYA